MTRLSGSCRPAKRQRSHRQGPATPPRSAGPANQRVAIAHGVGVRAILADVIPDSGDQLLTAG